jgi:hypothetical protein
MARRKRGTERKTAIRRRIVGYMAEFDRFLHESIGVESNGMELRVLSVLARQNLDPWDVALQLSRMPREPAISSLTNMLEQGPAATLPRPDAPGVAARLIALLPTAPSLPRNPPAARPQVTGEPETGAVHRIRVIVGLTLLMLMMRWLLAGMSTPEPGVVPPHAAAATESVAERTEERQARE